MTASYRLNCINIFVLYPYVIFIVGTILTTFLDESLILTTSSQIVIIA